MRGVSERECREGNADGLTGWVKSVDSAVFAVWVSLIKGSCLSK